MYRVTPDEKMVKRNHKKQQRINQGMKLLDNSFNIKTNVVKINIGNTLEHEMAKFKKSFELIFDGHTIITEAIFKNGSRADIFCIDTSQIFEILHSETEKMAKKKISKYPSEVEVFLLKSSEILE